MKPIRRCQIPLLLCWALSASAPAEELPLWDLAVGGGVLTIPEYRGSDDRRTLPFPYIYPNYRGKRLRVDDDGIRGILMEKKRYELDFSLDGNPPVNSDDSDAREGMPDLDLTVQIGPSLSIWLMTDYEKQRSLKLNLPVRAAFAIDFDNFEHVGYAASPHFTYHKWFQAWQRPWRLGLSAGLEFADEQLHDFYYQVDPQFATPTRPAFDADAGFGGTRFIATLISRTRKSWLSLFARYDRLDGATFEDSPLVERSDGLTLGFVYSRIIARSKRPAVVDPVTSGPR